MLGLGLSVKAKIFEYNFFAEDNKPLYNGSYAQK